MEKYQVIEQCYVPVGPGFKYKFPGQVVHLDEKDAADLEGFVVPLDEGVQELNTRPKRATSRKAKAKTQKITDEHFAAAVPSAFDEAEADLASARAVSFVPVQESDEEVTLDASEPGEAVQRAGTED